MRNQTYVVLDTETTGLRPGRHKLTEIYAARVDGKGVVLDEFHSLINPQQPIPSFITHLTGISDEMVEDAPVIAEVIKELDDFLTPNDILVGHNMRFDMGFLNYERTMSLGGSFSHQTLCTLLLARRVFSPTPLPSYKLGNLALHLDIDPEGAHRAKKDVEMTISLKQHLFSLLEKASVVNVPDIFVLQKMPLAKACKLFA